MTLAQVAAKGTRCYQAPAKPSQHANATYRNIVGCNMLRAFGQHVATCCEVLGVFGSNLTIFKLEPTTPNMSEHIATRWPNARNMLRPTMLRYVGLACYDRLAGALHRSLGKLVAKKELTTQQ